MAGKLGFLLFFLQLWQFGMPNQMMPLNESNHTAVHVASVRGSENNFPIQIGNKFYRFEFNLAVNWYQAAHNCRQLGGHLLNIESSKEMDAIISIWPAERFWVSANCLAGNREWISIATGKLMPYIRWHIGEPNNANEREFCVELQRTALNDGDCANQLYYVCEAKIL